jgi:uncharacterized protein
MESTGGNLINNLILFGRVLRGLGMDVDAGRMVDLVGALGSIQVGRREDFYHSLRCMLVHRREELALFDQAFELFWGELAQGWYRADGLGDGSVRRTRRPLVVPPPLKPGETSPPPDSEADRGQKDEPPLIEATLTYSAREMLRRKDFSELSSEEIEAIRRMIAELTWQLGRRRTHRFEPGDGRLVDFRRTLRGNFRYGGEVMTWARREAKKKVRPLVVIADISGSMERYTRLLLHFIYSLSRGFDSGVEAFVFSTRLTRITHPLRERSVDQALREVSSHVPDWAGGTRIGEALKEFNFGWARRVLGHGAVVILISDGWDRGDANLLRQEIARLQRSCYRLIWLNPLLGAPDYEPLTRGMQTALPFIDDFLPVHNLASLEDLAAHLRHIDDFRPTRRSFSNNFEVIR